MPARARAAACVLLAVLALAACAAPAAIVVGCPAVKAWSGEEQQALKHALASLPPGSILRPAVYDYERMRDEARACQPAQKPKSPSGFAP